MTDHTYAPALDAIARTRAVAPALFALALGVFILFGTGFAGASMLRDAAHDSRHTVAFPCH